MPPIKDITDPSDFIPPPTPIWQLWWFWVIVSAAAILLGFLLYFLLRKKSQQKHNDELLQKAINKLNELEEQAETTSPQTLSTRVSLIVRRYLEAAFHDPALFETAEEFTLRQHALENIHPELRQQIVEHLDHLSSLKYAPTDSTPRSDTIQRSQELLTQVHRRSLHP